MHFPGDAGAFGRPRLLDRASCSDSARSARSRSAARSSRREPMYMPQPIVTAVTATIGVRPTRPTLLSCGLRLLRHAGAVSETTATGVISTQRRRVASDVRARVAGPPAATVAVLATEMQGDRTGRRRRWNISANATRPNLGIGEEPRAVVVPLPAASGPTPAPKSPDENDTPGVAPPAERGLVRDGLHAKVRAWRRRGASVVGPGHLILSATAHWSLRPMSRTAVAADWDHDHS